MSAIAVKDLKKSYGAVQALRGIDLTVGEGEVFALLGPNGAGKTTTVEILEGYRDRDAGEVSVLGFDPARNERAYRERIGIVLQETGVEPFLTVAEVIELFSGYYPHPRRVDEVIEIVGLQEKRDTRVKRLSGGQQRRLDVAVGLAGDPDLLFLDEPTTGFDPTARRNAWTMIKNLTDLGKTVFLTTHYMDEAQHLAGRVAIIVDGKIVVEGPPSDLIHTDSLTTRIHFAVPSEAPPLPRELEHPGPNDAGVVELQSTELARDLHVLTGWALEQRVPLEGLTVSRPTLEDVYLEITAKAAADGEAR
ncbi:MAG: ABC transporter ATP-binding protein [Actinomycetota bacterium]